MVCPWSLPHPEMPVTSIEETDRPADGTVYGARSGGHALSGSLCQMTMVLRDGGQAAGGCTGRRSRSANTRFATKIAFNAFGKPQ